jgi:hypothetical protein
MAKALDEQWVESQFQVFVTGLLEGQGWNAPRVDDDVLRSPTAVFVSRAAVEKAFLKKYPEFEPSRDRRANVLSTFKDFPLNAALWKKVAGEYVKPATTAAGGHAGLDLRRIRRPGPREAVGGGLPLV